MYKYIYVYICIHIYMYIYINELERWKSFGIENLMPRENVQRVTPGQYVKIRNSCFVGSRRPFSLHKQKEFSQRSRGPVRMPCLPGDSACKSQRYRCSTMSICRGNLSICDTFVIRLLPNLKNCGYQPKELYITAQTRIVENSPNIKNTVFFPVCLGLVQ